MDNPEELYYQELEQQYLDEYAEFNKGDSVYFEYTDDSRDITIMEIGIILSKNLVYKTRTTRTGQCTYTVIVYDIVTPTNIHKGISECKITSAGKHIFWEYLKNNSR